MSDMHRLHRIRRGVRAALALGIAASLAANVLHADDDAVSRVIAAWPPVALAITVELVTRVPVASRLLSAVRVAGTASVAGIAAWVSYWHMAGVAARYGEDPTAAHLVPLSVDGLIVVASVCLVEIGRHVRAAEANHVPADGPDRAVLAPHVPPQSPGPDGDDLYPVVLDVARRLGNGTAPSQRAVLAAIRGAGHSASDARVRALYRAVVATEWPAGGDGHGRAG